MKRVFIFAVNVVVIAVIAWVSGFCLTQGALSAIGEVSVNYYKEDGLLQIRYGKPKLPFTLNLP